LFDVDGTLADTEETHRLSFNKAFAQAGLDWEWSLEDYHRLLAVTGGKERIRHFIEHDQPAFEAPMNRDEFIAGLHAAKTDIYTKTVSSGQLALRPGVLRLLEEARAEGLRLGIATTTTPANVSALLNYSIAADAERWFECIGAGGVVPVKKPAPDIYLYVMEKMGVSAAECLAFEDSENGLHAALGAGLPTLIAASEYTRDHDFSGAALVVDHWGEPDRPFRVLAGDAGAHRCVTVELLRDIHAQSQANGEP
jgi:beta-phosphoglucomutase-like phosphatase (HAD superfamily)